MQALAGKPAQAAAAAGAAGAPAAGKPASRKSKPASKKPDVQAAPRKNLLPEELYKCRIGKFDQYRKECQSQRDAKKIKDKYCSGIVQRCGVYGVGSPAWPIDFWPQQDDPKSQEVLDRIRNDPAGQGKWHFGKGRRCMTEVFWDEMGDDLIKTCGGDKPGFVARKNAAAAAAVPAGPSKMSSRSKKGGVTRGAALAPLLPAAAAPPSKRGSKKAPS